MRDIVSDELLQTMNIYILQWTLYSKTKLTAPYGFPQ